MNPSIADKFVATFRKGIESEKVALRQDSAAYEVSLLHPRKLPEMSQGERHYLCFQLDRPSDRLSPGVQCNLREPSGLEIPVTLVSLEGDSLLVQVEQAVVLTEGKYRLVFVPWFLYDKMSEALDHVANPESALRAFGKALSVRHPQAPAEFGDRLNATQQAAVQLGLESQLTVLWGPPGTGKTTTLAELVANLVARQRRILIASTTHAAIDQVLEKLQKTSRLNHLFQERRIVRLGFSEDAVAQSCSLGEVVDYHQAASRATLIRTLRRLEDVRLHKNRLIPILARSAQAAGASHQLDLFHAPEANLGVSELSEAISSARAKALADLDPEAQHAILDRRARRLLFLEAALGRRAKAARLALANGQLEAVREAAIVMSTLANTYVSPLLKEESFDCVILEEAGMAILPALFIAAGMSSDQVVIVGDPRQLPAILASRDTFAQQALGRNIFDVLGERSEQIMLDVQYRMHAKIGELVSRLFYGGRLRHEPASDTLEIAFRAPYPGHAVAVVDSAGVGSCKTDPGDFSRYNDATAAKSVDLACKAAAGGASVAIIAPYRKQVKRIQALLVERGQVGEQIHCATVHRFQGHERDVVILDTVDGPPMEPGTLLCGRGPRASSANLLNVSISRARGKLIIIADVAYIQARANGTILHQVLSAALS